MIDKHLRTTKQLIADLIATVVSTEDLLLFEKEQDRNKQKYKKEVEYPCLPKADDGFETEIVEILNSRELPGNLLGGHKELCSLAGMIDYLIMWLLIKLSLSRWNIGQTGIE